MAAPQVNYMLIPFEGDINSGLPQGLKLNLQEILEIEKGSDKLDISVSNSKVILDHFLSLVKNMVGRDLHSW